MTSSKFKTNYLPEIKALLLGREKPSIVSVNLTDRCNQKCIYCEIRIDKNSSREELLSKEDMLWIIDQMYVVGIKRLSMCGGEPFLFKEIIDVVRYANSKQIKCNITSNGMTIHYLSNEDLLTLSKCNTHINISIDSFDQKIQAQTRGNEDALSNALKSMETLKKYNIPFTLLSVISRYNYHELFNSFIAAYESGAKEILYQPVINYSNFPDREGLPNKKQINVGVDKIDVLNDQLEKIYQFERKNNIKTNVYRIKPWINNYIKTASGSNSSWFFNDILKKFYCREVHTVIDISYNGGIQPCGLALAITSIKDNKETNLLSQWYKAGSSLKNNLKNKKYPEICNGCCHKFSRNMIASVFKYPLANNKALRKVILLLIFRTISMINKKTFHNL
ncbi:MAG: radical SAM protein [Bacteroidales bacterium]|nr:radical SAM protein [Bacteroidales bacterium]